MEEDTEHLTLGQLLKAKAREGVRVCLLIWDDKTSLNNPLMSTSGLMATHDEDTRRYFKGTKACSCLFPRQNLFSLDLSFNVGTCTRSASITASGIEHKLAPSSAFGRQVVFECHGLGRTGKNNHATYTVNES